MKKIPDKDLFVTTYFYSEAPKVRMKIVHLPSQCSVYGTGSSAVQLKRELKLLLGDRLEALNREEGGQ